MQENYKIFLSIELPKSLTGPRYPQLRCIIEINDQSKTLAIPFTKCQLFSLKYQTQYIRSLNNAKICIKFILDKSNKIVGELFVAIPQDVSLLEECKLEQQFSFVSESTPLSGHIEIMILNKQKLQKQYSSKSPNLRNETLSARNNLTLTSPKRQQTHHQSWKKSEETVAKIKKNQRNRDILNQQVQCEVEQILKSDYYEATGSTSQIKNSESLHLPVDLSNSNIPQQGDSPSRISERVIISKSGTIIENIDYNSRIQQYTVDDSQNKKCNLSVNSNKGKQDQSNLENYQNLSCLYFLDQANKSDILELQQEKFKRVIFNQQQRLLAFQNEHQQIEYLKNQQQNLEESLQQQTNENYQLSLQLQYLDQNYQLENNKFQDIVQNLISDNKHKATKIENQSIEIQQQSKDISFLKENNLQLQTRNQALEYQLAQALQLENQLTMAHNSIEDCANKQIASLQYYDQLVQEYQLKVAQQFKTILELQQKEQDNLKDNACLQDELSKALYLKQYQGQIQQVDSSFNMKLLQQQNYTLVEQNKKIIQQIEHLTNEGQQQLKANQQLLRIVQQQKKEIVEKTNIIHNIQGKTLQDQNHQTREKNGLTISLQQNIIEIKSLKMQITSAEDQIQSLEGQQQLFNKQLSISDKNQKVVDELRKTINQLQIQLEDQQAMNDLVKCQLKQALQDITQLKTIITGMKESKYAYIPYHGDPIDAVLADTLHSLENHQNYVKQFERRGDGIYRVGDKEIYLKVENNKILVKVGGGFIGFEEFLDTYDNTLKPLISVLDGSQIVEKQSSTASNSKVRGSSKKQN